MLSQFSTQAYSVVSNRIYYDISRYFIWPHILVTDSIEVETTASLISSPSLLNFSWLLLPPFRYPDRLWLVQIADEISRATRGGAQWHKIEDFFEILNYSWYLVGPWVQKVLGIPEATFKTSLLSNSCISGIPKNLKPEGTDQLNCWPRF